MIVLPMAGLSSRFAAAGYSVPKYMLEAHGRSLFDQAVLSFARYFDREPFLFVARDVEGTLTFVEQRCRALGIARWECVVLTAPTRGQAETVELGLALAKLAPETPLTIFNIDTFRPGFAYPPWMAQADGFLEVFEGKGSNWSFARTEQGSDRVVETAEKREISQWCCTGLYHFAQAALFRDAYGAAADMPVTALHGGELYVAPLYNCLIAAGLSIRTARIDRSEVVFCGIPDEYDALRLGRAVYPTDQPRP